MLVSWGHSRSTATRSRRGATISICPRRKLKRLLRDRILAAPVFVIGPGETVATPRVLEIMSVAIRDAVLADLAALEDVFQRSSLSNAGDRASILAHPEVLEYSDEWVRRGCTRVASYDGRRILGFVTAVAIDDTLELEDLFVDPDWMRQGIGRALIGDIVARARSASVRRVDVTANPHAFEFYQAVGFVLDGEAETRFGPASRHASRRRTLNAEVGTVTVLPTVIRSVRLMFCRGEVAGHRGADLGTLCRR